MTVKSRRIKMTVFFILVLQFTGALSGDLLLSFTVRDGDEVMLSCENVINNHQNCDSTTWIFSDSRGSAAVELVNLGQIKETSKSDRLSVTADCSLVINNVTAEDDGRYTCRQFDKSGRQQGPDALVYLSVVVMTEQKNSDQVTLSCSVSTYERCKHKVKWIYNSIDLDKDYSNIRTSQSSCSATVSFLKLAYSHISSSDFKCSVTTEDNKVQLFTFSPRSSGDNTATTITTTLESNILEGLVWPYILVAVILVALLIVAVKVIGLKRLKGNKTEANGNVGLTSNPAVTQHTPDTSQEMARLHTCHPEQVNPEDGVSYASISYTKKANSKNNVWGKNDDEGETVTYSTVKASSTDPSSLYATIQ